MELGSGWWVALLAAAMVVTGALRQWLQQRTQAARRRTAGDHGEKKMAARLAARRDATGVRALLTTGAQRYRGMRFESDLVALVRGLGVLVIEVKNHSGRISCTRADRWEQSNYRGKTLHKNASLQAARTANLVKRIVRKTAWGKRVPVIPVVVYVHPDSKPILGTGWRAPQTAVYRESGLIGWLEQIQQSPMRNNFDPSKREQDDLLMLFRRYAE